MSKPSGAKMPKGRGNWEREKKHTCPNADWKGCTRHTFCLSKSFEKHKAKCNAARELAEGHVAGDQSEVLSLLLKRIEILELARVQDRFRIDALEQRLGRGKYKMREKRPALDFGME